MTATITCMRKQLRQIIINTLWHKYRCASLQIRAIEKCLAQKSVPPFVLDHFAIIDLPGPNTGISQLSQLFSIMGYIAQGNDYLPDKQNDFMWLAESDSFNSPVLDVLPQVVVADFRLNELPTEVKKIIEKYSHQAPPPPLAAIQKLAEKVADKVSMYDADAANQLTSMIIHYLKGRDWPLPTVKEFNTVQEFNELLAWVLVFGRRPNHFTLSVHLLNHFANLDDFHRFIEEEVQLSLNHDGGTVKGGKAVGIAQGSTTGVPQTIKLSDGDVQLPTDFIEFVWRYPRDPSCPNPHLWNDFFTGFVAQHADHVIESLYV